MKTVIGAMVLACVASQAAVQGEELAYRPESAVDVPFSLTRRIVGAGRLSDQSGGVVTCDQRRPENEAFCQVWTIAEGGVEAAGVVSLGLAHTTQLADAHVGRGEVQVCWTESGTHLWRYRVRLPGNELEKEVIYSHAQGSVRQWWMRQEGQEQVLLVLQQRPVDAVGNQRIDGGFDWLSQLRRRPGQVWQVEWQQCVDGPGRWGRERACAADGEGFVIWRNRADGKTDAGAVLESCWYATATQRGLSAWKRVLDVSSMTMRVACVPEAPGAMVAIWDRARDEADEAQHVALVDLDGRRRDLATIPERSQGPVAIHSDAEGVMVGLKAGKRVYVWKCDGGGEVRGRLVMDCPVDKLGSLAWVRGAGDAWWLVSVGGSRICVGKVTGE